MAREASRQTFTLLPDRGLPCALQTFAKVLTPLKVHSARLPIAFGQFYAKVGELDKKLQLPRETIMLLREQVARTNVCLFCIGIGRAMTIKASMNQAKFDALEQYRSSPLFSDAERAALDYVTSEQKPSKCTRIRFLACAAIIPSGRFANSSGWLQASIFIM